MNDNDFFTESVLLGETIDEYIKNHQSGYVYYPNPDVQGQFIGVLFFGELADQFVKADQLLSLEGQSTIQGLDQLLNPVDQSTIHGLVVEVKPQKND